MKRRHLGCVLCSPMYRCASLPSASVAAGAMHAIPTGHPEIVIFINALHQGFYRGGNLTPTFRGETRRGMGVGFSFEVRFYNE